MSTCCTLPQIIQVAGGVDGVINGGSYDPITEELTLTTTTGGVIVIAGFTADTSLFSVDGTLAGQRTVDMAGNDITWQNGGDFIIDGKLTVTGLIDPTGVQFTDNVAQPDASMPNTTIYVTDGSLSAIPAGELVFKDGTGNYHRLENGSAAVDLSTTVSDQTGADYVPGSAPIAPPAAPDDGDVHIETYDDAVVYWVASGGVFPAVASAVASAATVNIYNANGTLTGNRTVNGASPFPGIGWSVLWASLGGFRVEHANGQSLLDLASNRSELTAGFGTDRGGVKTELGTGSILFYESTGAGQGDNRVEVDGNGIDLRISANPGVTADLKLNGAPGANGEVLTSAGPGNPPVWAPGGSSSVDPHYAELRRNIGGPGPTNSFVSAARVGSVAGIGEWTIGGNSGITVTTDGTLTPSQTGIYRVSVIMNHTGACVASPGQFGSFSVRVNGASYGVMMAPLNGLAGSDMSWSGEVIVSCVAGDVIDLFCNSWPAAAARAHGDGSSIIVERVA